MVEEEKTGKMGKEDIKIREREGGDMGEETREEGREGRERGGERGDEREVKEVANIYKLNFSPFRLKFLFPL